jgi:hypothetical protein
VVASWHYVSLPREGIAPTSLGSAIGGGKTDCPSSASLAAIGCRGATVGRPASLWVA